MFRLIRGVFSLIVLAIVGYMAFTVPLGSKTLWEHLKAISETKESKQLVDGVKGKAEEGLARAIQGSKKDGGLVEAGAAGDNLTPEERSVLRKLIKKKLHRTSPESVPGTP